MKQPENAKLLGVGVIGLGIGEQHARAYQAHPQCQVAILCDLSEEKLAALRPDFPDARLTLVAKDVIGAEDIAVVSIASYDQDHYEQTCAALQSGKHVFVEKPLCRSQEELIRVNQIWREQPGLMLTSNLVLRSASVYRWLKAAIKDDTLGEIYAFDGDYLYGRLEKITTGWRKDTENYSVMQGGGIHMIDLMLWLTGQKPSGVSAVGNRISTTGSAFRYDDFRAATFAFPSGLVGRITANFGSVHRHQHVVRVFGTKGTFICDDLGPRLHTSRNPASAPTLLSQSALPASKGDLIPAFIDGIVGNQQSLAIAQHEFAVISACIAADTAAETNSQVEIAYV